MNWWKSFSGKSDTLDQNSGNQGLTGTAMTGVLGTSTKARKSGYPNGSLLNNITGEGKGGFFNNFAGGVFGGNYWTNLGRAFAGKSGNKGGQVGQFGTVGDYAGGLGNAFLNQNNQNQDASFESALSLVGGGGKGSTTLGKEGSLGMSLAGGGGSGSTPSLTSGTGGLDSMNLFSGGSGGSSGMDAKQTAALRGLQELLNKNIDESGKLQAGNLGEFGGSNIIHDGNGNFQWGDSSVMNQDQLFQKILNSKVPESSKQNLYQTA
jgi:hypothetical protein